MTKRAFLLAALFALAGILLPAATAGAQVFGVGGQMPGGYGYYGPYFNQPYGSFYSGANYGGYAYPGYGGSPYYGGYFYPGYSGFYQPGGYGYGGYPYVGGYPYCYGGYGASVLGPTTSSVSSPYPAIPNIVANGKLDKPNPGVTTVIVKVPNPDAEVWFGNVKTKQTGLEREFVTPPLEPGKPYKYEVRASWIDNKVTAEHQQTITFAAGQPVLVDFRPKGVTEKKVEKKLE